MAVPRITYPHITTNPNILHGVPVIEGTRVPVRAVAGYYQMGMLVDEIVMSFSGVTLAQAHAALSYYFDHQQEVDEDVRSNNNVDYWESYSASHANLANERSCF